MRLAPGIAIVFGNAAPSIRAIIVKQRAMWKRTLFCLAACFSVGVLQAQTYPLPPGTVGVPYSIDFGQGLSEVASEFAAAGLDASFTYNFAVSGGGLAPGLSMSASGLLSGTPTTPGPYTFTVTFTFTISIEGFAQSGSFPYTLSLDVTGNARTCGRS